MYDMALKTTMGSSFSTLNNNTKMYEYKRLIEKSELSIQTIDKIDKIEIIDKKTIVREAKSNALKKACGRKTDKGIVVVNDDLNIEIVIGREGILHSLERKRNNYSEIVSASLNIGELLRNSIAINELSTRTKNHNGSIILLGVMNYVNKLYAVRIIVTENKSFDSFRIFSLSAVNTKKEDATHLMVHSGLEPVQQSSTISIKELLNYCKVISIIASNFSKDVKEHFNIKEFESDLVGLKY